MHSAGASFVQKHKRFQISFKQWTFIITYLSFKLVSIDFLNYFMKNNAKELDYILTFKLMCMYFFTLLSKSNTNELDYILTNF